MSEKRQKTEKRTSQVTSCVQPTPTVRKLEDLPENEQIEYAIRMSLEEVKV